MSKLPINFREIRFKPRMNYVPLVDVTLSQYREAIAQVVESVWRSSIYDPSDALDNLRNRAYALLETPGLDEHVSLCAVLAYNSVKKLGEIASGQGKGTLRSALLEVDTILPTLGFSRDFAVRSDPRELFVDRPLRDDEVVELVK